MSGDHACGRVGQNIPRNRFHGRVAAEFR